MVPPTWFDAAWPFIGLGGAIVMVAVLLTTDTFRGNVVVSRWRDPVWLGWLAVPLYWVHQFEEYSLPVLGFNYSIQEMICKNLGFAPYPDCPIPLSFYPVVNIALMWFGAPLAAYLGRRNVLIGLSFWGLLLANGLLHTAGGVAQGAYNTGLWSSVILFVPLSLWVIYACAIRGPYSGKVVGVAFAAGALACPAFHRLRVFQERGDRQCGPAGLCRRDRFHADHLGGPREPVLQACATDPAAGFLAAVVGPDGTLTMVPSACQLTIPTQWAVAASDVDGMGAARLLAP